MDLLRLGKWFWQGKNRSAMSLAELMPNGNSSNDGQAFDKPENPFVKQAVHLRDRRARENSGLFLIEGYREILRATDISWKINTLMTCPDLFLGTNEGALIERLSASGTEIIGCTDKVFQKMSYRDRPDGLLAIAPQKHFRLEKLMQANKNRFPFMWWPKPSKNRGIWARYSAHLMQWASAA